MSTVSFDPDTVQSPWTNIPVADRTSWLGGQVGYLGGMPVFHSPHVPDGMIVVVDEGVVTDVSVMPMFNDVEYRIDIYPVGVLKTLQYCISAVKHGEYRIARNRFKYQLKTLWRHIKGRRWHTLKCQFNGYLCELTPWPEDVKRCGSGWTKMRAIKSMIKQVDKAGLTTDAVRV